MPPAWVWRTEPRPDRRFQILGPLRQLSPSSRSHMQARSRARSRSLLLTCVFALVAVLTFGAASAHAFKPYTHNFTGDRAWEDVTDDGRVTIEGREYAVRPQIV